MLSFLQGKKLEFMSTKWFFDDSSRPHTNLCHPPYGLKVYSIGAKAPLNFSIFQTDRW